MKFRAFFALLGGLTLPSQILAQGSCSTCEGGDANELGFNITADSKGTYSVRINDAIFDEQDGNLVSVTNDDTNVSKPGEEKIVKLVVDTEYTLTVDVGEDADESNDYKSDEAKILFDPKDLCGVKFMVWNAKDFEWTETTEATVYNKSGNGIWGFGNPDEEPLKEIKIAFISDDGSEEPGDSITSSSHSSNANPGTPPSTPTDQPSGINPPTFSHTIGLGYAAYYTGNEKVRPGAGRIRLAGAIGDQNLADRANAKYTGIGAAGTLVQLSIDGSLHKVETGKSLTILEDNPGGNGFTIKIYGEDQYTVNPGPTFSLIPSAVLLSTTVIENVAPAGGVHVGGIRITTTQRGATVTKELVAPDSSGTSWRETILDENGNALQTTDGLSVYSVDDQDPANLKWMRTDQTTITRDGGTLYSKVQEDYVYEDWGDALVSRRVYYSANDFEETVYTYYDDSSKAYHGHLKERRNLTDGSWSESVYLDWNTTGHGYAPGSLLYSYGPWLDGANSSSNDIRQTEYFYQASPKTANGAFDTEIASKIQRIKGVKTGETDYIHTLSGSFFGLETAISTSVDKTNTLTRYEIDEVVGIWEDYPTLSINPDNSATQYSYAKGDYNSTTGVFTASPTGEYTQTIAAQGYINLNAIAFEVGQSTRQINISDPFGRTVRSSMEVWQDPSWAEVSVETIIHEDTNGDGLVDKTSRSKNGTILTITQAVSDFETHAWDMYGQKTVTIIDSLGRTLSVLKEGLAGQANLLTTYSYSGRNFTVTVSGGGNTVTTSTTSDLLGRTLTSTDQDGLVTTSAYTYPVGGGLQTTMTRPDGNTEITTYHIDGQVESMTGSGVVPTYYTYSVDGGTGFVTNTTTITNATPARYTATETDWMGRTVGQSRPAFGSGTWTNTMTYSTTTGQLIKAQSSGVAPTLYEYDSLGNQIQVVQDTDSDDMIDTGDKDSITETITEYVLDGSDWIRQQTSKQWLTDGVGTPTTMSVTKSLLASPFGESTTVDVYLDETVSTTTLANDIVTTTVNVPYSDTDIVTKTVGGRTISQTTATASTPTTYTHDDLGRLIAMTNPLGAVTNITYFAGSYRRKTVTPPVGPSTEYTYVNSGNGAGQIHEVITRDRSSGTELSKVTYTYDALGNVTEENGSGTYPKEYVYDSYGQRTQLKTFRDKVGFPGQIDTTTWTYDAATGLVTRKQYDDGKGTNYTYDSANRLATRAWSRNGSGSNPLVTTYTYDSRGMQNTISYSDGTTTTVDYDYNRAGRLIKLTDDAGIHTFTHHLDGQVNTESISGGLLDDYTITHAQGTAGHGLRDSVSITDSSTTIVTNSYTYESTTGRLQSATQAGHVATYGYRSNTNWEATIAYNDGTSDLFTKRTLRDIGGRIAGVTSRAGSAAGGAILASAGYQLDSKGRRTSLTREDGTKWDFGYNDRDEVTSGDKKLSNGNLLAGRQFEYEYDDMGNRQKARFGGDAAGANLSEIEYSTNRVNQYTTIEHPGTASIVGFSTNGGTITATPSQQRVTKQGDFWSADVKESNDPTGKWSTIEVKEDGTVIDQGKLWIPAKSAAMSYDLDGNLISDERWNYTWNGENRLTEMTPTTDAINEGHPWMRLTFDYDAQGRRIRKKVESGSSGSPTIETDRIFLYDGWNLIAEIETKSAPAKTIATYLWGMDLSGSEQGAGGVGGLLLCRIDTDDNGTLDEEYRPTYDGNGNIIAWIDDVGAVAQRIDYDPFGQVLTRQGTIDGLEFGFSTKYTDGETDLCYYGYRYYDPSTGRWPSRDPIEEEGGSNLYCFVKNNANNQIDVLGEFYFRPPPTDKPCKECGDPFASLGRYLRRPACALKRLLKTYKEMKNWNRHGADKYFHCLAFCRAKKECGIDATDLGILKEVWDLSKYCMRGMTDNYGKPRSVDDMLDDIKRDLEQNRYGMGCADSAEGCKKCCKEKYPKGAP